MPDRALAYKLGLREGGRMNLRQIEVFRSFMLTGTISDAARLLGVSQPAVSSMLHHIQDRSGIRLFEQVKGRLIPTQDAQSLFAEITVAWKSVERVQRLGRELAAGRAGSLRIAASTNLATHVIPAVLKRMDAEFPELAVSLELFTPSLLVECLVAGDADIGAASYNVDHPAILTKAVGSTPIVCVMPRGHSLASRASIKIADLAEERLVTHSFEMPEGSVIAEAFRAAGIAMRSRLQVRSGQSACWFVLSGAGVALLDATTIAGNVFTELVTRPLEPTLLMQINVLRSPLKSPSRAALAFGLGVEHFCRAAFPLRRP